MFQPLVFRSLLALIAIAFCLQMADASSSEAPFPETSATSMKLAPHLSSPSVKNGGMLTIGVHIESSAKIESVRADIGGLESVELKESSATAGLYSTDWIAHGLSEKNYRVTIRATDVNGFAAIDTSLQFSDPIAGNDTIGTNIYKGALQFPKEFTPINALATGSYNRVAYDPAKDLAYYLFEDPTGDIKTDLYVVNTRTNTIVSSTVDIKNLDNQTPGYGLDCALDAENNFLYFTGRTPGPNFPYRAYRLNLNLSTPSIDRQFNIGLNSSPLRSRFDPIRKKVYFLDIFTTPTTQLIQVEADAAILAADPVNGFKVLDTLVLDTSFGFTDFVLDPASGFAYLNLPASPTLLSNITKVDIHQTPMQKIQSIAIQGDEQGLAIAAIDTARGFAYCTSSKKIIKYDISPQRVFQRVASREFLESGRSFIDVVIDEAAGVGYAIYDLGTVNVDGNNKFVRFDLDTLQQVGSTQSFNGGLARAFVDARNGYLVSDLSRVNLTTNAIDGLPVKVAEASPIAVPVHRSTASILDPGTGGRDHAVFYGYSNSNTFYKYPISTAPTPNLSVAPTTLALTSGGINVFPKFAEIDTSAGYAYVLSYSQANGGSPTKYKCPIAKVNLATYAVSSVVDIVGDCGERDPRFFAIDPIRGVGYVGIGYLEGTGAFVISPRIIKFSLGTGSTPPAILSTTLLEPEDTTLCAGFIDPSSGYLYIATNYAEVAKLRKYRPTSTGLELLGSCEFERDQFQSLIPNTVAVADPAKGFGYFVGGGLNGLNTARITRVALGSGLSAPQIAGSFGLPAEDIVGFIPPPPLLPVASSGSGGGCIDTENGYLYIGCREARIVKIDLANFKRLGATVVTISGRPNSFYAGGQFDPATQSLYFSNNSFLTGTTSIVTEFNASGNQQKICKGFKITVPELAKVKNVQFFSHAASGNVQLAIYDNSEPKKQLWKANTATPNLDKQWVSQLISNGTPATLQLDPGTYWLSWEIDTTENVPSLTRGIIGDGFSFYTNFGTFPALLPLTDLTQTDQVWSQFISYEAFPTVTTSSGTSSFAQGSAAVPIDPGILVKDSDDVLTAATVVLGNNYDPVNDLIEYTQVGSIAVTSNANGTLQLAGSATQAQWQMALRSVKFRNTSLAPIVLPRTATFTVTDGPNTSAPATKLVNISAPTLDLIPNQTVLEDSGVNSVALTGISSPGGFLEFIYASDNTALIPNSTQPTSISGTSALLNFTPVANASGSATLTVTVRISNGTPGQKEAKRSFVVTVTPVNDAPVAANQNLAVKTKNPLAVTLTATDVENGGLTYQIISSPQNGTLSGTAPNLIYTSNASYTGPDSFTFRASDGSADSNLATVSFTVTAVSTIPTVTALSKTTGTLNQAAFTLTITGTNFVNGAVASWNGAALATTFVSATQVTALVTSTELAIAGQISVLVTNPAPNMVASNALSFSLYSGALGNYIVTNTNDSGQGSLRLAMASVRNGDSVIFDPSVFDLVNSDAETLINVLSELPLMDDGNVTIDASNRRVSVNGSGANSARGIVVDSDGNTIRGLTLLGFARSGISLLPGAANNSIGGGRSTGGGPNGQGLRISGNGTYGIEILGAGTTGNTVKGCWIGLDAGGSGAQPNLAGLILGDGATENTIGSIIADEENIISGNSLEGITVAGSGTNDNVIIGNTVGASAVVLSTRAAQSREGFVNRSAVANGSAGLFLSKGTNGTKNGGTNTGEGNNVAFNGGNGLEVRSTNARKNSARGNRVTANSRGGIALFDGSNDNIKAPILESFLRIPVRASAGTLGRSAISAHVKGTAGISGNVEFFNDSGAQGAVFLGRNSVANGAFEADIDVDDLLNLTATFTDENGNTSPFGFFGRASGNAGTEGDSDGDGVSDEIEKLVGTDPLNAATAPTSAGALAVDSTRIGLNFASTNKDSLAAVVRVALPEGFVLPQSTAGLMFGKVAKTFTLDSKLRSPKSTSSLKASKSKTGSGALFTFALKNEDLKAGLTDSGLTDTTTAKAGENKTATVFFTLKNSTGTAYVYAGNTTLTYKATQGKSGKAANAK